MENQDLSPGNVSKKMKNMSTKREGSAAKERFCLDYCKNTENQLIILFEVSYLEFPERAFKMKESTKRTNQNEL